MPVACRALPRRARPIALLAVAASAAGLASCGEDESTEPAASPEGGTIAIGSIFSTSGPGIAFGPQQLEAAELAVEEINEAGGVDGAEIVLEQRDDASKPRRSAREMRSLITDEGVLAVLGPTFSNSAAEAHPVADELGTAVLAVSNTGPGIVGDCAYPCDLVFRDSLGEAAAIPANAESYAAESNAKRAAVIHPLDDPFGESTAEIAADALAASGIEVTGTEVFAPLEAGPQPAIEAAINSNADAIFVTASSGEVAADVIEIARDVGFDGDVLGGNAFNSALAAENAGAAGRGARSAAAWFAGNDSMVNASFIGAYRERYDAEPDQFAAQAYTGVRLLAAAAEDADLTFDDLAADREALAEALADVELETPLGAFSFTADHDVVQPIWIVEMDGEGGYELVEELDPE
jgi:branched-chain amino acid transport system substrate-binding protein